MNQDQVITAISVLVLAFFTALWLMKRAKMHRARNWPPRVGKVESTDVVLKSDGGQPAYYAELKYSYNVLGQTHFGSLRRRFILKGRADKWIAGFAGGDSLTVRYNPQKPKDSVLLESDHAASNIPSSEMKSMDKAG